MNKNEPPVKIPDQTNQRSTGNAGTVGYAGNATSETRRAVERVLDTTVMPD